MAKYLDWGGVQTLWSKIKTWVAGYVKFETEAGTGADAITIGSVTKVPIQSITAGTGLNTTSNDSATDGGTIGMGAGQARSGTLYLTKSGVASGNYGPSADTSPSAGSSFSVPYLTVDKYGRITAASTKSITVPSAQTITQDGITGATINRYGACSTAANTAAKVVSVTNGTVPTLNSAAAGLKVTIKFTNANTADSPTLNVSGKGAKNIYHNGAQITTGENKALLAGICDFVYDGTQWHLVGNYMNTKVTSVDNHYEPSADNDSELTGTLSGTAGTYALNTEYTVLTGVKAQRDSKGHVTGLTYTAQKVKDTNTDTKVTQAAAITTNGSYPIILGYNTGTAAVTNTVNKASTLTYNPSTKALNVTGGQVTADNFNGVGISNSSSGITIGDTTTGILVENGESYTLGAACAKDVDTSIGSSTSNNLPTTEAVRAFVNEHMATVSGALIYQGTVTSESQFIDGFFKKGYYYIVAMPNAQTTSVTIGGVECEAGDMVIFKNEVNFATAADIASSIDVVQSNIAIITDAEINSLT